MYIFMGYWARVVEISIDGPDLGGGELAGFIRVPEVRPRHGTTFVPGWLGPD